MLPEIDDIWTGRLCVNFFFASPDVICIIRSVAWHGVEGCLVEVAGSGVLFKACLARPLALFLALRDGRGHPGAVSAIDFVSRFRFFKAVLLPA